jgi:hypothetical protein
VAVSALLRRGVSLVAGAQRQGGHHAALCQPLFLPLVPAAVPRAIRCEPVRGTRPATFQHALCTGVPYCSGCATPHYLSNGSSTMARQVVARAAQMGPADTDSCRGPRTHGCSQPQTAPRCATLRHAAPRRTTSSPAGHALWSDVCPAPRRSRWEQTGAMLLAAHQTVGGCSGGPGIERAGSVAMRAAVSLHSRSCHDVHAKARPTIGGECGAPSSYLVTLVACRNCAVGGAPSRT